MLLAWKSSQKSVFNRVTLKLLFVSIVAIAEINNKLCLIELVLNVDAVKQVCLNVFCYNFTLKS